MWRKKEQQVQVAGNRAAGGGRLQIMCRAETALRQSMHAFKCPLGSKLTLAFKLTLAVRAPWLRLRR
jgi:hypothetical protein